MLDIIRHLRQGPETSASLREALAKLRNAIPAAEQDLRTATEKRTALMTTGTTRQLRDAGDALRDAGIELSRLEAVQADLTRKLAETEAAEAKAALDRERGAADAVAEKLSETLQDRYDAAAAAIIDLLNEIANADAAIAAVNSKLMDARRGDFLRPVEARLAWLPEGWQGSTASLHALTSLRSSRRQPGYGPGRTGIEWLGRKP